MTEIGIFRDTYLKFPKIIFMGSDFKPHTLTNMMMGLYDPDWGVFDEIYKPGRFGSLVDDTKYNNAPGMEVSFKHTLFGNTPLKGIGPSHFHTQHIVSTNGIRPQDVQWHTEGYDIIIFADIERNPPHAIVHEDNSDEALIEITPFLSPSDLERLKKDSNFLHEFKVEYIKMESKVSRLESKVFVKTAEAASVQTSCVQLQHTVNGLLQEHRLILDDVLEMQLETHTFKTNGIKMLEKEHNFGFPRGQTHFEDLGKTAALLQDNVRVLQAQMKLNGDGDMSDTQAWALFNQCVSVLGMARMLRFIHSFEQHDAGGQRVTFSQNPSLTELLLEKAKMGNNGQMSTDDFTKMLETTMDGQKRMIRESPTVNGAVAGMKQQLIGNGNGQVTNAQ